jgi:hypothetical protein
MFKDLHDEVASLFEGIQEEYADKVTRDILRPEGVKEDPRWNGRSAKVVSGFRVFFPNPPKTPDRKRKMREYEHRTAEADIRERLLAGERPKLGGRGRPPTRWFKVAAELGIDLRQPEPTHKESPSRAALIDVRKRARTAGQEVGLSFDPTVPDRAAVLAPQLTPAETATPSAA